MITRVACRVTVEAEGSTTCTHTITESTSRIMVEVKDPQSAAGSDLVDIIPTVVNTKPAIGSLSITPSIAYTNDIIQAQAATSDGDGDPWTFFVK